MQGRSSTSWNNQYQAGPNGYAAAAPEQVALRSYHEQKHATEDFGRQMPSAYGAASSGQPGSSASFNVHKAQHPRGYQGLKEPASGTSFMGSQGHTQEDQARTYAGKGSYGMHQASMPYNKAAGNGEERVSMKDSIVDDYCRDGV